MICNYLYIKAQASENDIHAMTIKFFKEFEMDKEVESFQENLRYVLDKDVVIFDGAMGTYIAQKYQTNIRQCEYENLHNPVHVLKIHKEYIEAGAEAIKTNTFSANTQALGVPFSIVKEVISTGCRLAKNAVKGHDVLVFASIGPIADLEAEAAMEEYRKIIDCFLENGVDCFLFETFNEYEILGELAFYVKSCREQAFVITECTVGADAYTKTGISSKTIIDRLYQIPQIDAYGFNCTCGPGHLLDIVKKTDFKDRPVSIMPNAGYPSLIGGRTVFNSTPEYFAGQLLEIKKQKVKFLGGCCGTTPDHIRSFKQLLQQETPPIVSEKGEKEKQKTLSLPQHAKIKPGMIAVELDSPFDTSLDLFLNAALKLKAAGADMITIADCPIGRPRVDSSLLCVKLKRELGMDVVPHLTCRDRNINATKALLLGLAAEGVDNVLVVTGDPLPNSDRDEARSVFHFNSLRLASYINDLNSSTFADKPFYIFGALNVNAVNFPAELAKAQKKQAAGMSGFLTQPIYSQNAIDNLKLAKKELSAAVLGGIMPVVSYKNACFINNEVPGITIPDDLLVLYENATAPEAQQLAIDTSWDMIKKIRDIVDGFYLIVPLKKTELILSLIEKIKENKD